MAKMVPFGFPQKEGPVGRLVGWSVGWRARLVGVRVRWIGWSACAFGRSVHPAGGLIGRFIKYPLEFSKGQKRRRAWKFKEFRK